MPSVGDTFPTRHALQTCISWVSHSLSYRSAVINDLGTEHCLYYGCPRGRLRVTDPRYCAARGRIRAVDRGNVEGAWEALAVEVEHSHAPEVMAMGTWQVPRRPTRRTRQTKGPRKEREEDGSEGSSEEVPAVKQAGKKRESDPKASSTKPRQSLPAKLPSQPGPHLPSPRRLSSFTRAAAPSISSRYSTTSRLLTPAHLSHIPASFYPSLYSLGPILHENGVRSTNGVMALVSMEKEPLVGLLEKLEVRKLQRTMLVGKLAELREELGS